MKAFLKTLLALLLSASPALAQLAVPTTNAGTTGTTLNALAIINSSNNAVIATTGSTTVPTYIVVGGAGTAGQAQLATTGQANCIMDSTIASGAGGYYVIASVTTAGDCHAQSTAPTSGVWIVGYLAAASTTSGTASLVSINDYTYGGGSGAVASVSGDGALYTNSSSTGAVTLALGNAAAHKFFGNNTSSAIAGAYDLIGVSDLTGSYVAGGGTAQAQTATLVPAATALTAGLEVLWKPAAANTAAAPTLAANSLTATAITKCGTAALVAGDLTTTAIADAIYDGTEWQLMNPQAVGCGAGSSSITGSAGQNVYLSAVNTLGATSAIFVNGATSASQVGIDTVTPVDGNDIGTTVGLLGYQMGATMALIGGSGITATSTTATITGGTALNPTGGYAYLGYTDGGSTEYVCYSAASATSITFGGGNCGNPNATTPGRGYWNSTANSFGSGKHIAAVTLVQPVSNSVAPNLVELQDGSFYFNQTGPPNANQAGSTFVSAAFTQGVYLGNNITVANLSGFNNSIIGHTNNSNVVMVTQDNTPSYLITAQTITGTSLTAITNAVTALFQGNTSTGVLNTRCRIMWNQATGGTIKFGVTASAAPTGLWVSEQDSPGTYVAPVYTTITSTTTTQTSGTITPSAYGTTYASDLWITMQPGGSNNVSVQLYALTSSGSDTLTIEPGTGCTGWF